LNPSSNANLEIVAPSKQGSKFSPKIQSFEIIASLMIKNSAFKLLSNVQSPYKVFSSNSID